MAIGARQCLRLARNISGGSAAAVNSARHCAPLVHSTLSFLNARQQCAQSPPPPSAVQWCTAVSRLHTSCTVYGSAADALGKVDASLVKVINLLRLGFF